MCRCVDISSVSDKMTTTAVPSVGRGVAHTVQWVADPGWGHTYTHVDTYRHI